MRLGQVGANYFRTFDMSIVAGRAIEQRDVDAGNHVVVINESLARNLGGNALGVRVRFPTARDEMPHPWYEVVGVVRNLGLTPTADGEADYMYMPLAAEYAEQVVLHVHGDANAYAPRLRAPSSVQSCWP